MAFKYTEEEYKRDRDSGALAHASSDGKPHTNGHAFEHGRRGSGTWPDGTSKTSTKYNQDGKRTFADGTPVTSTNYSAFKKNPDKAPKKKKK